MNDNDLDIPAGLGEEGSRFYRAVLEDFEFDAPDAELLRQACILIDRISDLDAVVAEEGVSSVNSQGRKAHWALVEGRQMRLALIRLIKALGLPDDEVP